MVWTAHPLNIMAVTYVIQRHTSMAGAFSVWSVYFYHLSREENDSSRIFFGLSAACLVMAALNKETALVMPMLIFAYKLFFFDRFEPGWIRRNWKWILFLVMFYFSGLGIVLRPSMSRLAFDFSQQPFGPWERLFTEFRVLLWYVWLILFPFPQLLSAYHEFSISSSLFSPISTAFALAAIIAIVAAAIIGARKWQVFSFAVIWYFGQLLIEALPLPIELTYEHRLYLASLSMIAPAVSWLVLKFSRPEDGPGIPGRAGIVFSPGSPGGGTWIGPARKGYGGTRFPKARAFYGDGITTARNSSGLASARLRFRSAKKRSSLGLRSIRLITTSGICYEKLGQLALAENELVAAAASSPMNVGSPYFNLGTLFDRKKDYENASVAYEEAIHREPLNIQARYNLAYDYLYFGRQEEYLSELEQVLKPAPAWINIRLELASTLAKEGKCDEAGQLVKSASVPSPELGKIILYCQKK